MTSILQQIDFIIDESLGFFGDDSLEPAPALRAALQVMPMIAAPEPPELSLLHEELAASMASVSREFPKGVVPVECASSWSSEGSSRELRSRRTGGRGHDTGQGGAHPWQPGVRLSLHQERGPKNWWSSKSSKKAMFQLGNGRKSMEIHENLWQTVWNSVSFIWFSHGVIRPVRRSSSSKRCCPIQVASKSERHASSP